MTDRSWDPGCPEQAPGLRDWILYTDGSGHADGYGGWGCWGCRKGGQDAFQKMGGQNRTSTARMEAEALLQGLEEIADRERLLKESRSPRPTVWWLSDRQDLVLSAAGLQERKANPDLWARFEYWSRFLDLHPFHRERASTAGNRICDRLAGAGRKAIKNYFESEKDVRKSTQCTGS